MSKVCSKCKSEKDESEFGKDATRKDGLHYWCKECVRKQGRKYYLDNRETILAHMSNRRQEHPHARRENMHGRQEARIVYIRKIKAERGCERCGEKDPLVLTFHHKDSSTRKYTVSGMGAHSIEVIDTEIAKCVVLCRNCHVRVHQESKEIL